jgi:hypothetical protein
MGINSATFGINGKLLTASKIVKQKVGCPFIRHIFFIRIMNIFDLLFEYSNNIRIFILLNKLPILAQKSKKIQKTNPNWVEITE